MYTEPEKNHVRKEALENAISILTRDRTKSTIADIEYPRRVRDFIASDEGYHEKWASFVSDEAIKSWQGYYKSLLGKKKPSELKVAFLAGPNPENDIDVMLENGILPENIWAFESDNGTYKKAVDNLKELYPRIKLFKNKIGSFFRLTPIRFDIVYLDSCSPIFTNSDGASIKTLVELFKRHALYSPGVLITNYSLPSEEGDKKRRNELAFLASLYLYPKKSLNDGERQYYPSEIPCEFSDFYQKVIDNIEYWYGEFITRLIMDLSSVVVPLSVFAEPDYFQKFFSFDKIQEKIIEKLFLYSEAQDSSETDYRNSFEYDDGAWAWQEMDEYAIPWTLGIASNFFDMRKDVTDFFSDIEAKEIEKICDSFVNQIIDKSSLKRICAIYYVLFAVRDEKFYSGTINEIMKEKYWNKAPYSCDVFTAHSLMGALLGQVSVPYHVNVDQVKRWTYQAKETRMYTDLLVMDECRYIYDMVPTMDMILTTVDNIVDQLLYRFVLDALDKNLFHYNQEWFVGNAMVGINHKGFEDRILRSRIVIPNGLNLKDDEDCVYGQK